MVWTVVVTSLVSVEVGRRPSWYKGILCIIMDLDVSRKTQAESRLLKVQSSRSKGIGSRYCIMSQVCGFVSVQLPEGSK